MEQTGSILYGKSNNVNNEASPYELIFQRQPRIPNALPKFENQAKTQSKDKYTNTNQVSMKVHNQVMDNHNHVLLEDTHLAFIKNLKNLV